MDTDYRKNWLRSRDQMMDELTRLGFPAALGEQIIRNLGSPKAMDRMTAYLKYVKPKKAELVVDEMLAIMSDIEAWRDKRSSQEANARYNEVLNYGLGPEEE